jgi:hypothetical protein
MTAVLLFLGMPTCGLAGLYVTAKVDQKFDPRHPALQAKMGPICQDEEDSSLHLTAFRNEGAGESFARFCGMMVKGLGYGCNIMSSVMLPLGIAGVKWKVTGTPFILYSLGGISLGCVLIAVSNCLLKMGTKTANAYLQSPEGRTDDAMNYVKKIWQRRQVQQLQE